MTHRAVITAVGLVGPMALDPHRFWEMIRAGESAIRKIERFDSSPTGCFLAGEVPEFSLNFIPAQFKSKRQSRHTHLLLKAAEQLRGIIPKDGLFNLRIGFATSDLAMISDSGAKRERSGFENALSHRHEPVRAPFGGGRLGHVPGLPGRGADRLHRLRFGHGRHWAGRP